MSMETFWQSMDGKQFPKSLIVEHFPEMPAGARFKVTEIEKHPDGDTYYTLNGPQLGHFATRKAALQAIINYYEAL